MKKVLFGLILLIGVAIFATGATPAFAADCTKDPTATGCPCADKLADGSDNPAKGSGICPDLQKTNDSGLNSVFKNVINILLAVAGIIAVIMIVVSGIRLTASHGKAESITKGRSMLIYSIIGLVIAVLAFAIVNFVLGNL